MEYDGHIDELVKDVTPLLMHWSYVFLALTHRYGPIYHVFSPKCSIHHPYPFWD